ncbi:hypothetical protein NHQ30_010448 [Ciborinia camelliae]|nr:hypothetical protein NHQ30_010448 [Ciborinia camelliae]
MSQVLLPHYTTENIAGGQIKGSGADISDYIPIQPGRNNPRDPPQFNVVQWLSTFYGQQVPPLPEINFETDIDELPDQRLQETMEEYQLVTPTVKKKALDPFNEIGVSGYPLIEDTKFNIVRSYPADEQYNGPQNLLWTISNSYYRAVAWAIYGNWELWPHVKSQHRTFFNRAIEDPKHPRHVLYHELNRTRKGHNNLNLLERLGIPYCAVRHEDIQQITADLYGVFLVVFLYQPPVGQRGTTVAQEAQHFIPTIRGEYNNPHKFIRLTLSNLPLKFRNLPGANLLPVWQLYEPMMLNMPAPARHSDFRYVRPTFENTKARLPPSATGTEENWDGHNHPWRKVFSNRPGYPAPLTHPPRWGGTPETYFGLPVPKSGDLSIALGCYLGGPEVQKKPGQQLPTWIRY